MGEVPALGRRCGLQRESTAHSSFPASLSLSLSLSVRALRFSPNSLKPEVSFKSSQTPTPGNKNIVGFSLLFLFKIKTMIVDVSTGEINKTSFCLAHEGAILVSYRKSDARAERSLDSREGLSPGPQVRLRVSGSTRAAVASRKGGFLTCRLFPSWEAERTRRSLFPGAQSPIQSHHLVTTKDSTAPAALSSRLQ